MAITSLMKSDAADGITKSMYVTIFDEVGGTIATKSVNFSASGAEWSASNVVFENLTADTIVTTFSVSKQSGGADAYIEDEVISGTEAERTVGPAGGIATFSFIRVTFT